MKTLTAAALAAAAAFAAPNLAAAAADVPVPSGVYALDKTHANILFQVQHAGLSPYTARFDEFDAELTLDVEDPTKSAVTATVNVGSLNVNYRGEKPFKEEIAFGEKFLNGKAFPEITFTSKSIEMTSETTATITGDLAMLGVTKEITLDAELTGAVAKHPFAKGMPAVGFSATGQIDRTEWGFTNLSQTIPALDPAPIVGKEVTLSIQAEFVKAE